MLDTLIVYVDESGETTVAEITDIDGDGVPDLIAMQIDTPGLLTAARPRQRSRASAGLGRSPDRPGKHLGYPDVDGIA